jgi:hypothetical protein
MLVARPEPLRPHLMTLRQAEDAYADAVRTVGDSFRIGE